MPLPEWYDSFEAAISYGRMTIVFATIPFYFMVSQEPYFRRVLYVTMLTERHFLLSVFRLAWSHYSTLLSHYILATACKTRSTSLNSFLSLVQAHVRKHSESSSVSPTSRSYDYTLVSECALPTQSTLEIAHKRKHANTITDRRKPLLRCS